MPTKKVTTIAKKAPAKKREPKEVSSATLSAPVYDAKGKKVRDLDLPVSLFGAPRNSALVYQVVTAMQANARTPVAHTKTRGEVRGGGRKPWKQKGTGRARHGSSRSPIWKGGGITFGPRNDKSYTQKINKKMRVRALAAVLSQKFAAGQVLFVDSLSFAAPKTKDAKASLVTLGAVKGFDALATRRNNAALIALGTVEANTKKSFRNIGSVMVEESRNLNPVDVMNYRYLVIADPEISLELLEKRMNPVRGDKVQEKEIGLSVKRERKAPSNGMK